MTNQMTNEIYHTLYSSLMLTVLKLASPSMHVKLMPANIVIANHSRQTLALIVSIPCDKVVTVICQINNYLDTVFVTVATMSSLKDY